MRVVQARHQRKVRPDILQFRWTPLHPGGKTLHGAFDFRHRVPGKVHRPEPAAAQFAQQFILVDPRQYAVIRFPHRLHFR